MKPARAEAASIPEEWERISSFKPCVIGLALAAALSTLVIIITGLSSQAVALAAAAGAASAVLLVINFKVVWRRGGEYRVSTLFYTETLALDDICMTVRNPRPFWTRLRIHLKRPARFGWVISFASREP